MFQRSKCGQPITERLARKNFGCNFNFNCFSTQSNIKQIQRVFFVTLISLRVSAVDGIKYFIIILFIIAVVNTCTFALMTTVTAPFQCFLIFSLNIDRVTKLKTRILIKQV